MLAPFVCPFVLLVSGVLASINMYQPLTPILPSNSACEICNEIVDCVTLHEGQCQYYQEMDTFREQEPVGRTDEALKEQVDIMLMDYVEQVLHDSNNYDCIPYISEYTDCSKENLCTGCNRCTCDGTGTWNCTVIQQCKAKSPININHSVLLSVIQNLKLDEIGTVRSKRAALTRNTDQLINYDNIYNWWYGNNDSTMAEEEKQNVTTKPENNTDLDFNEVLNNIAEDDIGIHRKEYEQIVPANVSYGADSPNPDSNNIITFRNLWDMVNLDNHETEETNHKITRRLVKPENKIERTKFNLDLTENVASKSNIVKRSQSNSTETNHSSNYTKLYKDVLLVQNQIHVKIENESLIYEDTVEDLKDNVFNPLNEMIKDKQIELKQLITIRDSLTKFMSKYSVGNYSLGIMPNMTNIENNTVYSVHEIDTINGVNDFRRTKVNIIEKLRNKLKHDIYEILKDVAAIHKLSKHGIPQNMQLLVRAIKYYIRNLNNIETNQNARRYLNFNESPLNFVNKIVIKILETIDTGMPESNALSPLSYGSKRIISRIIKNNQVDQGLVINNDYDMKLELENIGFDWKTIINKVLISHPADQIYRLKLLHMSISADIEKISKALSIFDFTKTRRMMPIDQDDGENIMAAINNDLFNINKKVQKYITQKYKVNVEKSTKPNEKVLLRTISPQKKSFMKQLKNFLKNSKSDIMHLLKNKVSKTDIIKQIAMTKLNDITNKQLNHYENTMKDWQRFFNVSGKRNKRSARYRITHILPTYLIGKVRPVIIENGAKNRSKENKNKHLH